MNENESNELTEDDVLNIVGSELSDADNYQSGTGTDAETALDFYLGSTPGPAPEGRSSAVSTDVADAIEWIMPQIMKAFVGRGQVVEFAPTGSADEKQADIEAAFVHDIFMNKNNGFVNLYTMVKDALLQRNGVLEIEFVDDPKVTTEEYENLTPPELQAVMSSGAGEIEVDEVVETELPTGEVVYAVALTRTVPHAGVEVRCVPPEEFRVNSYHNSIDLSTASFTARTYLATRSELLEAGFDPEKVNRAATGEDGGSERYYRFAAQGEDGGGERGDSSGDRSQEIFEVTRSCMRMDIDGDGIAELVQIITLGGDTPSTLLSVEPLHEIPFVTASTIIMPHKVTGLSIYDRIAPIQVQKTALWRNILDNLYLQNNREKEVVTANVNMDDLLESKPGGIKRVTQAGSIREMEVQPIGQEGYQMLEYLDSVRTGRSGVSPDTAGNALPVGNDTAHGVERVMSAKEELTGLMIRAIAESAIKPAYKIIRDMIVRNRLPAQEFKYKGDWQQVDPSSWGDRSTISVTVGTGAGDDSRKQAALQQVMIKQETIFQAPGQTLVAAPQMYAALDDFCKASGLVGGAEQYFLDPNTEKGQQKAQQSQQQAQMEQQKQEALEQAMAKAQQELAAAEVMKGQAALQSQQVKAESEKIKAQAEFAKLEQKSEIDSLKTQLEASQQLAANARDEAGIQVQVAQMQTNAALKLTELEVNAARDLSQQAADNAKQMDNGGNSE